MQRRAERWLLLARWCLPAYLPEERSCLPHGTHHLQVALALVVFIVVISSNQHHLRQHKPRPGGQLPASIHLPGSSSKSGPAPANSPPAPPGASSQSVSRQHSVNEGARGCVCLSVCLGVSVRALPYRRPCLGCGRSQ